MSYTNLTLLIFHYSFMMLFPLFPFTTWTVNLCRKGRGYMRIPLDWGLCTSLFKLWIFTYVLIFRKLSGGHESPLTHPILFIHIPSPHAKHFGSYSHIALIQTATNVSFFFTLVDMLNVCSTRCAWHILQNIAASWDSLFWVSLQVI